MNDRNISNEDYCYKCKRRDSCPEYNNNIICDKNYYDWLHTVKECREKEDENGHL